MRTTIIVLAPALAATVALAGCGGASSSGSPGSSTSSSSSSSSSSMSAPASTSGATSAASCPTSNTKSFAKTRFIGDVGLAAGSFHRYIYKPFRAGTFAKGAHGRTLALVKAGATAGLDAKLIKNAADNAKANPTLCKALAKPLSELGSKLDALKSDVVKGDVTSIASVEGLVSQVLSGSKSHGLPVTESTG